MDSLKGIRIIDFTQAGAGPFCALLGQYFGAEVIKVESKIKIDESRYVQAARDKFDIDNSYLFNELNPGKKSITLNIYTEKGRQLFKKLITISDILIENMRPGVMKNFGLDYDSIRRIKPDIIMLSYSLSGQSGPESGYRGYASIAGALSGISNLTGYADGVPAYTGNDFDLATASNAFIPVLAAVIHRRKTGKGQYIDFSARESGIGLIGEAVLDYEMNMRGQSGKANQSDLFAPSKCYRCKESASWISISIDSDYEWQKFCRLVGHSEWLEDKRFLTRDNRKKNSMELDGLIAEWTGKYTDYEVMNILQNAGIAAFPSLNSKQLQNDPHLQNRGIVQRVDHPVLGSVDIIGVPWLIDGRREGSGTAPLLGEHNNYVFNSLLGLDEADIEQLEREEVIF